MHLHVHAAGNIDVMQVLLGEAAVLPSRQAPIRLVALSNHRQHSTHRGSGADPGVILA